MTGLEGEFRKREGISSPGWGEWSVEHGVATVVMDMTTIYQTGFLPVLYIRLSAVMLGIEGLANLGRLTQEQVFLIVLPLGIRGRDGSPCRAIALESDLASEFPGSAGSVEKTCDGRCVFTHGIGLAGPVLHNASS
ncbi:MAG TPA: hypothetical protein VNJ09_05935 [Chthonomonadales bacterium]|nr:hypothetical protein [Chthonomonadales bacterium]